MWMVLKGDQEGKMTADALTCSECGEKIPYDSHEHICPMPGDPLPRRIKYE